MVKQCDGCQKEYRGFGTTCPECRKSNVPKKESAPANNSDICAVCGKKVYAMEKHVVEGMTFHKDCFKCSHPNCGRKLGVSFSRAGNDFYCGTHYKELFKLKGRYEFEKNDSAANHVDAAPRKFSFSGTGAAAEDAVSASESKLSVKERVSGVEGSPPKAAAPVAEKTSMATSATPIETEPSKEIEPSVEAEPSKEIEPSVEAEPIKEIEPSVEAEPSKKVEDAEPSKAEEGAPAEEPIEAAKESGAPAEEPIEAAKESGAPAEEPIEAAKESADASQDLVEAAQESVDAVEPEVIAAEKVDAAEPEVIAAENVLEPESSKDTPELGSSPPPSASKSKKKKKKSQGGYPAEEG